MWINYLQVLARFASIKNMQGKKDYKAIDRVRAYREKGLSFRAISGIMGKDLCQIYRWYKYGLNRYPQGGVDNKDIKI